MECTECGQMRSLIDGVCEPCLWARLEDSPPPGAERRISRTAGSEENSATTERATICPRCRYQGQGTGYFTRGSHILGLIAATLFTLPYALGAGGFIYYAFRRDHQVCPECGQSWGRAHAHSPRRRTTMPQQRAGKRSRGSAEVLLRSWSVILLVLGGLMLLTGTGALGAVAIASSVLLHFWANRSRRERRQALITELQLPVLKLAARQKGRLTVTQVATALGWPIARAEKILQSLDDGWRVNSVVTDAGILVYEFRELMLGPGSSSPGSEA